MLRRSIGNDIVDLSVEEPPLHPRYITRAFSRAERTNFDGSSAWIWARWAAKEAAYKAVKRVYHAVSFIPSRFEVSSESQEVHYENLQLPYRIETCGSYVHVCCAMDEQSLGSTRTWIAKIYDEQRGVNPSDHIRTFAADKIASTLGIPVGEVTFSSARNRPASSCHAPALYIKNVASTRQVSFSHHGRYVACALSDVDLEVTNALTPPP